MKIYLEHENESYFRVMEDSWVKIITKGKISFNDFSYLSAFDLKFLKFKIRQYQILYLLLKIMILNLQKLYQTSLSC